MTDPSTLVSESSTVAGGPNAVESKLSAVKS